MTENRLRIIRDGEIIHECGPINISEVDVPGLVGVAYDLPDDLQDEDILVLFDDE